jgi:hypothetical protein
MSVVSSNERARLGGALWLSGLVACAGAPALDAGQSDVDQNADAAAADTLEPDAPSGPSYGTPRPLGELTGVPETSGIVASRDHAGVFWIHNDSGHPAEIYAIDASARVLATLALEGATNQDWEDIAIAASEGVDVLYVGDVGDNLARTSDGAMSSRGGSVRLYRLEEPDPRAGDARVTPSVIELVYPDGPHDCEAIFSDPRTGDLYLLAKVDTGTAGLYRGRTLSPTEPTRLERVASLEMAAITAADTSSDGARLVVRSYTQIRVFVVDGDLPSALARAPLRPSARGSAAEAIAFAASGWDLYTIAEGDPATLFRIAWE